MRFVAAFNIDPESEDGRYLLACCRIRDLHPSTLTKRILKAATEDKMIENILDDGGMKANKAQTERGFKNAQTRQHTGRQQDT